MLLRVLLRRAGRRAAAALLGLAASCAARPDPAPRPPSPAASARAVPAAASAEAPGPSAAPSASAEEPACLPEELRKGARVVHAERVEGDQLAYCVQKGIGLEAPQRCFTLDTETASFRARPPGSVFSQKISLGAPELPASNAGAMRASVAGTLQVCGDSPPCLTVRLRPPEKDAWDEVFASLPAWAPPGTSRVIVADTKEGPFPKIGPPPATLWLDVYDLKQKRKVASARVQKDTFALRFLPIGRRALLAFCERDDGACRLAVVDPDKLTAKPLALELHPDLPRGSFGATIDLVPVEGGGFALSDVRGTALLVLNTAGEVTRTVKLPNASDPAAGGARAGPWSRGRVLVLESGPSAGAVHVVDPRDGTVKSYAPPACAGPP